VDEARPETLCEKLAFFFCLSFSFLLLFNIFFLRLFNIYFRVFSRLLITLDTRLGTQTRDPFPTIYYHLNSFTGQTQSNDNAITHLLSDGGVITGIWNSCRSTRTVWSREWDRKRGTNNISVDGRHSRFSTNSIISVIKQCRQRYLSLQQLTVALRSRLQQCHAYGSARFVLSQRC